METVEQPRQIFHADSCSRLGPQESLCLERIRRSFLPNTLVVYDPSGRHPIINLQDQALAIQYKDRLVPFCYLEPNGNYPRVKEDSFQIDSVAAIEALICVPVNPWFDYAVMPVYTGSGESRCPSLVDIPEHYQRLLLADTATLLRQIQTDFGVAYWGTNNSMGGLSGLPGLMSLMDPHWQVGTFSKSEIVSQNPTEIIRARKELTWDNGLSRIIGDRVATVVRNNILPNYYATGIPSVESDSLGLTFSLPGFTPKEMANPRFIENFWRRLSHIIHHHLCELHSEVFESNLCHVVEYVTQIPCSGYFDQTEYQTFFQPKSNGHTSQSHEAHLLRSLVDQGQLRPGFGWAASAKFFPDSTFFAITFGIGAWPTGPVEGLGLTLHRPTDSLPPEIMSERSAYYQHLTSILTPLSS